MFKTADDYNQYLDALREQAALYGADILAYCLLPDRVHLLLVPRKKDSLAKTVGRTHFWYAQYHNRRRNQVGKLWHDRFHSCPIEEKLLDQAVQFVEFQPVFDKIATKADKYAWSSAKIHISAKDSRNLINLKLWPKRLQSRWAQVLGKKPDPALHQIQRNTQTGRPWGSEKFITGLEKKFKRRLHAMPTGRPRSS